ncbi:mechanosensitive ion channel family protein [Janibacter alittae]|uniref:Mechanosensitive ion channel domain-containing protein n=1 Tax=Janibacter alittae TaxID=3115209 RepID=A0ABZ2MGB6_9MICO
MASSSGDFAAAEWVGDFLGLPPLQEAELAPLAAAIVIGALALVAGWIVWRWIRTWLEMLADRVAPGRERDQLDSTRLAKGFGQASAGVLLSFVAAVGAWPAYAEFAFDVAITVAVGLSVYFIVAGVFGARSVARAAAVVVAAVTISRRYERLDVIGDSLDAVSFTLGSMDVSLLDLLNFAVGILALYATVKVLDRVARTVIHSRTTLDASQRELAEKLTMIILSAVAVFVAIDLAGINTAALSIFSGTLGVGLGFGLQKVVSNFTAGIVLLSDRSVKPGDTIVIDTADVAGEVTKVGTRAVSVLTRDGKVHLIPNETLLTERVENWGYEQHRVRLRMPISVMIGSDYDLVQRLMVDAARGHERVLAEPPPRARITAVADNGVTHELRFWISDPEQGLGNVRSATYRRILDSFAEHEVLLSNPSMEIAAPAPPSQPLTPHD